MSRATCRPSRRRACAPRWRRSPIRPSTSPPSPPMIVRDEERTNPNVVKVVGTPVDRAAILRALYFTRATAPRGEGPLYHHIGLYAYRRAALERFVALPPSPLEKREKLEQLRALEAGMRIDVAIVDAVPLGVDTPADLDRARAHPRHVKRFRLRAGWSKPLADPVGDRIQHARRLPQTVADRSAGKPHAQNQEDRLPGRARRQFAPRLPRGLPERRARAVRDLRGLLRRGREGRGRPRHDPDRQLARRARRRHPPSPAGPRASTSSASISCRSTSS